MAKTLSLLDLLAMLPARDIAQTPRDSLLDQLPAVDVTIRGVPLVDALRPAYLAQEPVQQCR